MQPSDITLDHLLNNDSFIAWVVSNGEQDSEYWNGIKETLDDKTAAILDKAANIIEKIQLLYTDREESKITTEFIQQQYIKLLEAQNSKPHIERRKVFTIQTVFKYAAILILLLTVSGIYYFTIDRDNAFEDHLTATTFNEKDILIETPDHEFFAINDETKNNWLTEKGVFVSVDGEQIKFVASDAVKDSQEQFKVHTPIGKRYHVFLTDGTKIELNSNSVLTFGLSNLGNQRNASLIGEAFFDVTHNERSPFTVHSSDLMIKVLGTEFNISNYPENGYTSATLIEGSVEVRNSMNESVVIKPGTQAKIYPGQKNIEVKTVDVQEVVAWTSGRMIFNNEKFIDLVPRLNRWYGANFVLSDKELDNVRFTGTLKKENDLTHFLQMLKYTEGISYEISDDQVKLFINK